MQNWSDVPSEGNPGCHHASKGPYQYKNPGPNRILL